MTKKPIISIIIPVYNAEKHIELCIENILSQTFKDYEIICIDDGSTDASFKILNEQKLLDKRIRVINQENRGPGAARNLGISLAMGTFICFIDIDDCFTDNNSLTNLICAQMRYNSDFVVGKISVIDSNSHKQIKIRGWNNVQSNILYKTDKLYNKLFQCISAPVFAKLYKKEIILKYNIKFSNYKASEDMLFVYTYILNCTNVIFIKDLIVNYSVFQECSLSSFNSYYLLDSCYAYKDLKKVIQEKKLNKFLNKTFLISYISCLIYVLKRVSIINKLKVLKEFLYWGVNLLCE